jgi:hypothetical protein
MLSKLQSALTGAKLLIAAVVLAAIAGGAYLTYQKFYAPNLIDMKIEEPADTQQARRPIFDTGGVTVADSSGNTKEVESEGGVDAAINIEPDSTRRTLFVRAEPTDWLPAWRGRSQIRVTSPEGVGSAGITVTTQQPAVFGWDWSAVSVGGGVFGEPYATTAYTPLRVGPVELGGSVQVSSTKVTGGPAIAVEVRQNLHVGIGSSVTQESIRPFIAYKF